MNHPTTSPDTTSAPVEKPTRTVRKLKQMEVVRLGAFLTAWGTVQDKDPIYSFSELARRATAQLGFPVADSAVRDLLAGFDMKLSVKPLPPAKMRAITPEELMSIKDDMHTLATACASLWPNVFPAEPIPDGFNNMFRRLARELGA